ncbi:MAG: hypothetical protein JWM34_1139 [Ilumatobacteraceae bacterium]|nr:hypothetical protein [Ilumatobacteraceae bacterium]
MRACDVTFETLDGWRIIAEPGALDTATWAADATVVRISPDDAYVIGGAQPALSDEHAIVTPEHGFVGATVDADQLSTLVDHHIEWQLPAERPALAQGQIASVPAKLVLHDDGSALLLVATAAHHELAARIGGTPL